MNKEFFISVNGDCPDELIGKKMIHDSSVDKLLIQSFFNNELFGLDSVLLSYYSDKTNAVKYSVEPGVDIASMSAIRRMTYYRKKNKRGKELENKEQEIKMTTDLIKKHSAIVVDLCSKYELNVDGSYKEGSKFETILFKMSKVADLKTNKLFADKMTAIRNELNTYYQILKQNIGKLGNHDAYFKEGSMIGRISYEKLMDIDDKNNLLLDTLLDKKIKDEIMINRGDVQQNEFIRGDDDFIEESIKIAKKKFPVYNDIAFLQNSRYITDNELNLLTQVENAYNLVSVSQNKFNYLNDIIISLGNDSRFLDVKQKLEKEQKIEEQKLQILSNEAEDKYNKFDIKACIEDVKKRQEIAASKGDLDASKKNADEYQKEVIENKAQRNKFEEKEVNKKTVMAQYLREKAFKTELGKLPFEAFVQRLSEQYHLQEDDIEDLVNEGVKSGRKF